MTETILIVWMLAVGAMAVCIPWYLWLVATLQRSLRDGQTVVWEALGRPLFPLGVTISTTRRFVRFFKAQEYRRFGDADLVRRFDTCRRLYYINLIAYGIGMVATITILFHVKR